MIKKIIAYILLIGFLSYIFFGFIYCKIVFENLIEKEEIVKKCWIEYIKIKDIKKSKSLEYAKILMFDKNVKDSLLYYNQNEFNNENQIYKLPKLKEFIINEYYSNLYTMKLTDETVVNNSQAKKLKDEIISTSKKANDFIEDYNTSVLEFNKYRSTFPNFFIANKYSIKNIDFFTIKYGQENKNPKIKSNIQKWIETGDSIYLNKL